MTAYSGQVPDTAPRVNEWVKRAACAGRQDEMHPDNDEREIAAAKAICKPCPVARECFWDAVATDDMHHGIRAGLRANARRDGVAELERRRTERTVTA